MFGLTMRVYSLFLVRKVVETGTDFKDGFD